MVVVPVLARPWRVAPLASSLAQAGSSARLLLVCSPEDEEEIAACRQAGVDYLVTSWPGGSMGDYARKVNMAYRCSREEWIMLAADDLRFHPGWAEAALAAAAATGARVIGTNDLGNPRVTSGRHATHCLVHRSYADQLGTVDGPGAVLAEAYWHNFVDDELVGTARWRGEWAFAREAVVEHLHPHWGKASMDATYQLGLSRFADDRRVYLSRCPRWQCR